MITGAPRARPFFLLLVVCTFCTRKRYVCDVIIMAKPKTQRRNRHTTTRRGRRSNTVRYEAIQSRDKASSETGTTTQQPQEEEEEEENRREHRRRGKAEPQHMYHVPPRDERSHYLIDKEYLNGSKPTATQRYVQL